MAERHLLESYSVVRRELGLVFACELRGCGLGRQQAQILLRLLESPCSMTELSFYTQADPASTTRTVSALEKTGLVKRATDPGDARKNIMQLTAKGRSRGDVALKIREKIEATLEEILAKGERKDLSRLLEKVATGLSKIRTK
jgi:DNA-binding MarR family transcriptional regulator